MPSLGLFAALLKAWAVFHIPLRLMRTVSGPVAVILTNWACSCFSSYSPIYCNLNHYSYCNWDDLDLKFLLSGGRIIIRSNVTAYPGSEVSGHWLTAKSISAGMMAALKNLTKQLVNFTNDNDFFKVRWPLRATKIQVSVKRHVTRVHESRMPLVDKTDAHIFQFNANVSSYAVARAKQRPETTLQLIFPL